MKSLLLLLLTVLILSCKSNSESIQISSDTETITPIVEASNDTLAMIGVAKSFLHWYKENYEKANSFGFTYQDKQGNYHVAMGECEAYLGFLKSSGYLSDEYINLWMRYFKEKAEYMEENPENQGPPEGFEFDLVLITQEPELVLNTINDKLFAVVENSGTKAVLQMGGEEGYDFDMVKENGKWMIAYIATMNYD